eukprot:10087913-Ditylum_brightwellii.AAC.1
MACLCQSSSYQEGKQPMPHTAKVFRKAAVIKLTEATSSEANREVKAFSGFCRDVSPPNICCSSDK